MLLVEVFNVLIIQAKKLFFYYFIFILFMYILSMWNNCKECSHYILKLYKSCIKYFVPSKTTYYFDTTEKLKTICVFNETLKV